MRKFIEKNGLPLCHFASGTHSVPVDYAAGFPSVERFVPFRTWILAAVQRGLFELSKNHTARVRRGITIRIFFYIAGLRGKASFFCAFFCAFFRWRESVCLGYSPRMSRLAVNEVFSSIQGESSYAGYPCFFIRLAGCNLSCRWCDTHHQQVMARMSVAELLALRREHGLLLVEITGGEPLLQTQTPALAEALLDDGVTLLVETNGSCDLDLLPPAAVAVVDVKTPGSGECGSFDLGNLDRLLAHHEVKFVIGDRADYDWACGFTRQYDLLSRCAHVHFSPAGGGSAGDALAQWLLEDRLPVHYQVQLHKVLGVR